MKFVKLQLIILLMMLATSTIAQDIKIVDYDSFEGYLKKNNDTTYVINFWATWCIPCVKELPDFEKINSKYKNKNFKMLLVSLDFKSQIESSLKPFIMDKNLQAEVIILSDPNANEWINNVNEKWTGAIPATVIYNKNYYFFHEGNMNYDELDKIINENIN